MKKLVPIFVAGIVVGLVLAGVFLYLEFGGIDEQMLPHKMDMRLNR